MSGGQFEVIYMAQTDASKRDFFISYTWSDRTWAEWTAWQLEEAGYTTILQAWDFGAGAHFVTEMHQATQVAERTIAILSDKYIKSAFAEAEWQEAWRADPDGSQRKLLVFRIEGCQRPGLLGQLVSEDLFNVDEQVARSRLLAVVRRGRRKPIVPPGFPLQEPPANATPFPGRLISVELDEALASGGPITRDNPWAVAFAFWSFALNDDYESLETVITPESRSRWDLEDIRNRTDDGGITSGVMKPCYDVAYVRIMAGLEEGSDSQKVAGGHLLVEARIISLVLRPELDGWRVHDFGLPLDADAMPRTWIA
jgi:hypothetical protein